MVLGEGRNERDSRMQTSMVAPRSGIWASTTTGSTHCLDTHLLHTLQYASIYALLYSLADHKLSSCGSKFLHLKQSVQMGHYHAQTSSARFRLFFHNHGRLALYGQRCFFLHNHRSSPVKLRRMLAPHSPQHSKDTTYPSDHERIPYEYKHHHKHGDTSLLPVRHISRRIYDNAPPCIQ